MTEKQVHSEFAVNGEYYECRTCGALVSDAEKHSAWHEGAKGMAGAELTVQEVATERGSEAA